MSWFFALQYPHWMMIARSCLGREGAVYRLDDTTLMNSRNRAAQEVTCSGLLYVTVADVTAQKEVEFKVKRTADGKIIVSVNPFLF
jgi:hypothetical protein